MGNWSIIPNDCASVDDNGLVTFEECAIGKTYIVTYKNGMCESKTTIIVSGEPACTCDDLVVSGLGTKIISDEQIRVKIGSYTAADCITNIVATSSDSWIKNITLENSDFIAFVGRNESTTDERTATISVTANANGTICPDKTFTVTQKADPVRNCYKGTDNGIDIFSGQIRDRKIFLCGGGDATTEIGRLDSIYVPGYELQWSKNGSTWTDLLEYPATSQIESWVKISRQGTYVFTQGEPYSSGSSERSTQIQLRAKHYPANSATTQGNIPLCETWGYHIVQCPVGYYWAGTHAYNVIMAKCGSDPSLYPNYGCQCSGPSCDCTTSGHKNPISSAVTTSRVDLGTYSSTCSGTWSAAIKSGTDFLTDFRFSNGIISAKVSSANTGAQRTSVYTATIGNCSDDFTVVQAGGATPTNTFKWRSDAHPTAYTATTNGNNTALELEQISSVLNGANPNAVLSSNDSWIVTNSPLYVNNNEIKPYEVDIAIKYIYFDENDTGEPRTGVVTLTQKGTSNTITLTIIQKEKTIDCYPTSLALGASEVCNGDSLSYTYTMSNTRCTDKVYFTLIDASGHMIESESTPSGGSGSGTFNIPSTATTGQASVNIDATHTYHVAIKDCTACNIHANVNGHPEGIDGVTFRCGSSANTTGDFSLPSTSTRGTISCEKNGFTITPSSKDVMCGETGQFTAYKNLKITPSITRFNEDSYTLNVPSYEDNLDITLTISVLYNVPGVGPQNYQEDVRASFGENRDEDIRTLPEGSNVTNVVIDNVIFDETGKSSETVDNSHINYYW